MKTRMSDKDFSPNLHRINIRKKLKQNKKKSKALIWKLKNEKCQVQH